MTQKQYYWDPLGVPSVGKREEALKNKKRKKNKKARKGRNKMSRQLALVLGSASTQEAEA